MANYTNIPNQLFDDLAEGKINSKMFLVLAWLLRRADYSSGVAIKVSAPRIRAEMWGDELEIPIPSLRTIQEDLKRLAHSGYFASHHIAGRKASYAVSLNNYNTQIKGKDGALTPTVLRPVDTLCWRDLPEFCRADKSAVGCADASGDASAEASSDVAQTLPRIHHTALDLSDSLDSSASPCSCSDSLSRTGHNEAAADSSSDYEGREEFSFSSSVQVSVSDKGSAPVPLSIPEEVPDPKEYQDAVSLCSMWWAIHPEPISDTEPEPYPHPWGHPRTWTDEQRREAFRMMKEAISDDDESTSLIVPDSDTDDDIAVEDCLDLNEDLDAKKEEARHLRDEGHMMELVSKHGFETMYELLWWLPTSTVWYRAGRLKSLAQLLDERVWGYIYADMEKYYATAEKKNSEESCAEYVEGNFLEAGGAAADSICWERLNPPPPIDPADAAEEEAMDIFDDLHGVTVPNPWAAEDAAAAAEREAKGTPDVFLDHWGNADSDSASYSDTPHAREADEEDDAESEPPAYRYCEDCCSVHAGMCMPDDYSDSA